PAQYFAARRPARDAAAARGLLPLRPQPDAARPPPDARPVHAGDRREADRRRRLRARGRRDGAHLPVPAHGRRGRAAAADGRGGGGRAGLGGLADGVPAAGAGAELAVVRAAAAAGRTGAAAVEAALGPLWPVFVAAGGRAYREFPAARARAGAGAAWRRPG